MSNPEKFSIQMGATSGDFRYIGVQPPVSELDIEWNGVGETDDHWQSHRINTVIPTGKGDAYSQIGYEFTIYDGDTGIKQVAEEIARLLVEAGAMVDIDNRIKPIGYGYHLFGGEAEVLG